MTWSVIVFIAFCNQSTDVIHKDVNKFPCNNMLFPWLSLSHYELNKPPTVTLRVNEVKSVKLVYMCSINYSVLLPTL